MSLMADLTGIQVLQYPVDKNYPLAEIAGGISDPRRVVAGQGCYPIFGPGSLIWV